MLLKLAASKVKSVTSMILMNRDLHKANLAAILSVSVRGTHEDGGTYPIGCVKFLISPTSSYGSATAIRARVTHLPLMEHGVLMVKVVMKSVVIISIQHIYNVKWTSGCCSLKIRVQ